MLLQGKIRSELCGLAEEARLGPVGNDWLIRLMNLTKDEFYREAERYLKDADDAEDVIQEFFCRVYEKVNSRELEFGNKFPGWLVTVLQCLLTDVYRKHRAHGKRFDGTIDIGSLVDSSFYLDELTKDEQALLMKCFSKLTGRTRAVFTAVVRFQAPGIAGLFGLSPGEKELTREELAEMLGITGDNLNTAFYRAKTKMMKTYGTLHHER